MVAVPEKLIDVVCCPAQKFWFAGAVTVGAGLTVILNVTGVPEQEPEDGVTVMVEVIAEVEEFVARNEAIFPVPLPAKPIAVLSFTQE